MNRTDNVVIALFISGVCVAVENHHQTAENIPQVQEYTSGKYT